jgi:hypothetical protein
MQLYLHSSIRLYGVYMDKFTRTIHRLPWNQRHRGREAKHACAHAYTHVHVCEHTHTTACHRPLTWTTRIQSTQSRNIHFACILIYTLVFPSVFRMKVLYSLLSSSMRITRSNHLTLTNSTQQSPPWEANSSSATQQIPRILWKPKARYLAHNMLPLFSILSQINAGHAPPYFS